MSDHVKLPSSTADRVAAGLKIANDAYAARCKELENQIHALTLSSDQFRQAAIEAQKTACAADAQLIEAHRKIAELTEDLRQYATSNKHLTKQLDRHKKLQQTFAEALELQVREEEEPGPSVVHTSGLPTRPMAFSHQPPSPPSARPGAIDGKAFFAEVRKVATIEEFNRFLVAIKKLNHHASTREEIIAEAREIFGNKHPQLLQDFQLLVNRTNAPSSHTSGSFTHISS